MDLKEQRDQMVEHQIKKRGINNPKLLKVMKKIPRHLFVPKNMKSFAYEDRPLPIGNGQTISQPYMVAIMTDILELKGNEKILEIGAGSGYQAAILSKLSKKVISVERVQDLAHKTRKLLKENKYKNVTVIHGDGTKGYAKQAPYDVIIITAATPKIPRILIDQLADKGRIIAPVGPEYHQELIRIKKIGNKLKEECFGGCIFVPLIRDE